MSEKPNFSDYHQKGENSVKAAIRNGGDNYEISGKENDSAIAEKMAYAAKPLIDDVLGRLRKGEANPLATLTIDGQKRLNQAPGIVYEDGSTETYGSLRNRVNAGHQEANAAQVESYDKLAEATRLRREAAKLEAEVRAGL